MNVPYTWRAGLNLTLERYTVDALGRTTLVCSFGGVRLPELALEQNLDEVGFDTLLPQIESLALDAIQDALGLQ